MSATETYMSAVLQELTACFGGYLSFCLAVPPNHFEAALQAMLALAPGGHVVHALGGLRGRQPVLTTLSSS